MTKEKKEKKQAKNKRKVKTEQIEKYQFPKGVSGNPSGRPKGSKNKVTLLKEALAAKGLKYEEPDLYYAAKHLDIIEDEDANPAITLKALEQLWDRFLGKVESTIKHGRTDEELALLGRQVFGEVLELDEAEDAELIEK